MRIKPLSKQDAILLLEMKLDATTRTHAVAIALEQGLVDIE